MLGNILKYIGKNRKEILKEILEYYIEKRRKLKSVNYYVKNGYLKL